MELSDKSVNLEAIAKKAHDNEDFFKEILDGTLSKNDTIRYNCFKTLLFLSEEMPEFLYPEWDRFSGMLSSDNTYHKLEAVHILANLTKYDPNDRFGDDFEKFYGLLEDKSMVTSAHVAGDSGKIARSRPDLRERITGKLLDIDSTHHKKERIELIKSYIIDSFSEYYDVADNKNDIISFVKGQLNSSSPKTRKNADKFLKKWDK
ncbi:hypothetical protein CUJ83_09795 [Methanocella sp. CWC-04]|uniref:Uncharacterized protein n=1 Tax=Methanooceanicella nereidis TaxID=2052831 RepID=A0AAP2RD04_9EURY|nr:hypothetical protein [Methanocella sp. CWC-04]MCD1295291.1 hypothetical protein [Methanocella sp. CWC-04]